eukprot:748158-Hanusia_phi.AAC.5
MSHRVQGARRLKACILRLAGRASTLVVCPVLSCTRCDVRGNTNRPRIPTTHLLAGAQDLLPLSPIGKRDLSGKHRQSV